MSEADCPRTTFAVDRGHWSNLPAEFADMVAPPITVSSRPVSTPAGSEPAPAAAGPAEQTRQAQRARSRANMPLDRHRRPTR